jgi:undecaprenyl phosphate N,N'-diacetylbacillosamine 1-phosphate transferase
MLLKRLIDLVGSFLGLVLLALPFVLIALAIKLDSRGPVFFRQERIGKEGKPFRIWKFRSMVDGAERTGLGHTTGPSDKRITRVGRLMRQFSVDELPQLINVLKGEMSLIGPRPTLAYQVEQYTPRQRRRLELRPGVTSYASIKGRNDLSWTERIELDIWYVEHCSWWLDLGILLKTLWVAVVTRKGVYASSGVNDEFVARPPLGSGD